MATVPEFDDMTEGVRRINRESVKLEAEARKLLAEAAKLNAEELKLSAEERKLTRDRQIAPWLLLLQGALAGAALLGAGAALAKLLLTR